MKIQLKGRLNGTQRNRLKSLLNMMYKPSELGEEVGFSANQVYMVYVPLGCPHERDEFNHIWINGREFREWYFDNYQKAKLGKNEGFCLTCKQAVKLVNPKKRTKQGLSYLVAECPDCGRTLARILDQKRVWKNDKPG